MGRKRAAGDGGVNKGQAIRDALAKNPNALPKDLAAELQAQGIDVTAAYVSNVKTTMKSTGTRPAKSRAARTANRPARTATRAASPSGDGSAVVDLGSLVKAKTLVDQVGGIDKAQELLAALKKLQ